MGTLDIKLHLYPKIYKHIVTFTGLKAINTFLDTLLVCSTFLTNKFKLQENFIYYFKGCSNVHQFIIHRLIP